VLLLAVIAVALYLALRSSRETAPQAAPQSAGPAATWGAGARPAPAFDLLDEQGSPFSLRSLRGRPVIVTFIDPLCRDFCPREASVLTEAAAKLGAKAPAIVSVSVNPWADSRANFATDDVHWQLAPGWRWGAGSGACSRRAPP